jgi:hypothetical protein
MLRFSLAIAVSVIMSVQPALAASPVNVTVVPDKETGLGTTACPTEAGAVDVRDTIDYYRDHTFFGETEIVPSVERAKKAFMQSVGRAADNGCGFLGLTARGTLIGIRDQYIYAHWPALGEDMWVPTRAVVCQPAGMGKLRFACTNGPAD